MNIYVCRHANWLMGPVHYNMHMEVRDRGCINI